MSNVPTSPTDKQKLKTMLAEMTHCLDRIDEEREQMKEICADASEKFEIPKKLINKMARAMYKHNYADIVAEFEHFETLYESVVENKKKAA